MARRIAAIALVQRLRITVLEKGGHGLVDVGESNARLDDAAHQLKSLSHQAPRLAHRGDCHGALQRYGGGLISGEHRIDHST